MKGKQITDEAADGPTQRIDAATHALEQSGVLKAGGRVSSVEQLTGGWSRTAWVATVEKSAGQREKYFFRVKPKGALLDTDLAAEFRIYDALQDTNVPAPRVLYLEESEETPFGGPFFVAEHVEGWAPDHFNREDLKKLRADWDGDRLLAEDLAQNAARIHAMSADAFRAVPKYSYPEAVARWKSMYDNMSLVREPVIEEVFDWLLNNAPSDEIIGLVHGDYRIGNTLIRDGRIVAVLDWELAYYGDVRFDLGYLMLKRTASKHLVPLTELMGGVADADWFLERYSTLAGRNVTRKELRPFELLAITMLAGTQFQATWMYNRGRTADMRMAWSRFSLPGLRQDMVELMEW